MTHVPDTPLLDTVKIPADLRGLQVSPLRQLADELRAETISAVSVTGGHLGAGLGVVELTTAIATYNMVARFLVALQITPDGEAPR